MGLPEKFDVCIIGAGVAGGTLAAYLGKAGIRVAVIEKNMSEQERMIGELLQPGGVIKLEEMGLAHLLDGFDAQVVEGYGLFLSGDNFKISYPQGKMGRGFRNGKFIQKIRRHISGIPSVTIFEGTAKELIEENGRVKGVKYLCKKDRAEGQVSSRLTVVCDGMFSIFREKLSCGEMKVSSYFLGLVLKDCELPFKNHGHVIMAHPSPCLVYPISSAETRILIDFPQSRAPGKSPELTHYLVNDIAPQLPACMRQSFLNAVTEGKFRVMPNHLIPARPIAKAGVVMIGDSLNMRHPLTGGGMTAAFTDIQSLGNRLIAMGSFENNRLTDQAVSRFYASRHRENATINILADALYGVMQNEDLRLACYNYLKRGGTYAQEPVSILSAVSRDLQLLIRHFFAVALFGIKNLLRPFPTAAGIKRSYRLLRAAFGILYPLLMNERPLHFLKSSQKGFPAFLALHSGFYKIFYR